MFSCHASAYTLDDIEWSDTKIAGKTLHWGGTLKAGDYTVKAEDFDEDGFVSIGIYRDGVLLDKSPVRNGYGLEYRDTEKGDDLRVFVKSIDTDVDEWTGNMDDPSAAIEVYERGIPEMDITIKTDSNEYDPRTVTYQTIETTIDIKNKGDAKAYTMDVELDIGDMELADGDASYSFSSVDEDEVLDTISVKIEIPHYWEEKDVDITVITKSKDINGEIHEDSETKTITIEPVAELVITKSVPDEIYMGEAAHISVSIWNNGIYSLSSVEVSNQLTTDLEVQGSESDSVTLSFAPKETKAKVFEYTLKPTKTGKFTIPAATATFTAPDGTTHTFSSEKSKIQINGPDISVSKSVSPSKLNPGDKATVKVIVKNSGNKDASVETEETIPNGVTYVSGDLSFDDVAAKGKSYSYSYVIQVNEIGEIKLPETVASFVDLEDYKGEKISNSPVITVVDPDAADEDNVAAGSSSSGSSGTQAGTDDNSDADSPSQNNMVEPGFEAGLMIMALFAVYLVSKRKERS